MGRPIFRRQLGDPTTTLDGYLCTMESGAMALDYQTGGRVQVWGGQLVKHSGRDESTILKRGTNLGNVQTAWRHHGETLFVRSGGTWSDVERAIDQGRAVILQGDYDVFTMAERCQDSFDEDHAIMLLPERTGSRILRGDPLCSDFDWVEASQLRRYAEKLGRRFMGKRRGEQRIYYAISLPITNEEMRRMRPEPEPEDDDDEEVVKEEDNVTIVTIELFPEPRKFTTVDGLEKLRRFAASEEELPAIKAPYSNFVDATVDIEQSDNRVPHGKGFLRLASGGSRGFYILARDVVVEA